MTPDERTFMIIIIAMLAMNFAQERINLASQRSVQLLDARITNIEAAK